ncbi:MAG: alpha/beta hydrolase family protein [bacterium]
MAVRRVFRKKIGHWIDSLAWHSMHAISWRQERNIRPFYPDDLQHSAAADPALFFPAPEPPAQTEIKYAVQERKGGSWRRDFAFPSALPSLHAENNFVFVRALAAQKEWQRPAIIMLHGLMNVSMIAYRPFINAVLASGAAAYALELPYHHRRTPRGSISGDLFHTTNLRMTLHAVQQAVSDTRRLIKFLRRAGAAQIGILGFSLGAWIGGLAACCEQELDFAFLGMPPNHLNHLVWHTALGVRLSRRFAAQGWDESSTASFYDKLDPMAYPLLLPAENMHLYAAEFDSLIALDHVHALRRAWEMPSLRIYPHGHLSIMISRQLHRDFRRDLQKQLTRAVDYATGDGGSGG